MSVFSDFSNPRGFFMVTGVTFAAFSSGFGVCMFNLDSVGECIVVAHSWVDAFQAIGNHIIAWAYSVFGHVFPATNHVTVK